MTAPAMKRFTIFDVDPLRTRERESAAAGEVVFLCGHANPQLLGEVESTNAANALLAARDRWPSYPVHQLYACEASA